MASPRNFTHVEVSVMADIFTKSALRPSDNNTDLLAEGHPNSTLHATEQTDHSCRVYEFTISVVLVGVSCLFGIVGNVLSIVILRRDPRHSVTLFLLTVLAVVDLLFVLPMMVLFVLPGVCRFLWKCPSSFQHTIVHFDQYGWAIASMAHTATIYVTLLVTIHRFIGVCHPHETSRFSTLPLAKVQVVIVAAFAVIYNIPRFLEFHIVKVRYENAEGAVEVAPKRTLTKFAQNKYYQIIYKNICFYLLIYIIPLTTLVILTAKLARTLKARQRYRHRVAQRRLGREDNTTFVLIVIVLVFIVCQTPTPFQRLFYSVFGDDGRQCGRFFFYFERVADYLAVLNSCVNFMVYVIFARGFRQTLKNTFLGRRSYQRRKPPCRTSMSTYNCSPTIVNTPNHRISSTRILNNI